MPDEDFGFVANTGDDFGFVPAGPDVGFVEDPKADSGKGVIMDTASRVGKGINEGGSKALKGLGRLIEILGQYSEGGQYGEVGSRRDEPPPTPAQRQASLEANPLTVAGNAVGGNSDWYQPNPAMDDTFRAKVAGAVGGTLPSIGTGLIGGPLAMAITYGAQAGEQGAEEAIAAGKPEAADMAFLMDAGIGATSEMLLGGISKGVLNAVRKARGKGVNPAQWGDTIKQRAIQLAARTTKLSLGEGAQEAVEQVGNNAVARWLYDDDRKLPDNVMEAALVGAATGGLLGGGVNLASAASAPLDAAPGAPAGTNLAAGPNDPTADASPEAKAFFSGLDQMEQDHADPVDQTGPPELQGPPEEVGPQDFTGPSQRLAAPLTAEQAAAGLYTVVDQGEFDVAPSLLDRLNAIELKGEPPLPLWKRASQESPVVIGERPPTPQPVITQEETTNARAAVLAEAQSVLTRPGMSIADKVNAHVVIERLSRLEVPDPAKAKTDTETGKLGFQRAAEFFFGPSASPEQAQITKETLRPWQLMRLQEALKMNPLGSQTDYSNYEGEPAPEPTPSPTPQPAKPKVLTLGSRAKPRTPSGRSAIADLQRAMQLASVGQNPDFSQADPAPDKPIQQLPVTPADAAADKLANAEIDPVEAVLNRLYKATGADFSKIGFDPFMMESIGKPAVRALIGVVRAAYIGGKNIPRAIDAGMRWLKKNHPTLDEAKARAWLAGSIFPQPGGERDINQRDRVTAIYEDKAVDDAVKNRIVNQLYDTSTDEKAAMSAKALIEGFKAKEPQGTAYLRSAELNIKANADTLPGALVAKSYLEIMERYNEAIRQARALGNNQEVDAIADQQARMISDEFGPETTWAGQFLQALSRISKTSPEGALKHIEKQIEKANKKAKASALARGRKFVGRTLTQAEKDRVLKLAKAIEAIPADQLFARQEATIDLMDAFAEIEGTPWYDKPLAFWYANILSNPLSHLRNVVGSTTSLVANTSTTALISPIDAVQSIVSALSVVPRASQEALGVVKTGKTTGRRVTSNINPRGYLERTKFSGLKYPLNAWKYVGRLMAAEDTMVFYLADAQRQHLLAKGLAKKEGLKGPALRARVDEILNQQSGIKEAAEAKAKAEGYEGSRLKRRVLEIIDQGKDASVMESASEYALRTTFNNTPYGLLGVLAHHLNQINDKVVVSRAVIPFVNIAANVLNEALNYVPVVGGTRVVLAMRGGTLYGKPASKLEIQEMTAKALIGLAALASLAGLAARFIDDRDPAFAIYGNGPLGDSQRKTWIQAGHIPFSFKIGKRHVSYMQTPLALVMATIGNYHDALRYRDLGNQEALDRLAYGVHGLPTAIINQSFLSSLSDFMEGLKRSGGEGGFEKMAAMTARASVSLAIPAALNTVDQYINPKTYDRHGLRGAVLSTIPFARAIGKPAINGLGQVITRTPHDSMTKSMSDDPVWRELARVNAGIMPREASYMGKTLSDQQLYNLVRTAGPVIRAQISAQLPALRQLPAEESRKRINQITQRVRDRYKPMAAR